MSNSIDIVAQAFYGNRVGTEVKPEKIDRFILGFSDFPIENEEPIDRTIIRLPNEDNLVIVYNKYAEEKGIKFKERALKEGNYIMRPLAVIPELNIELYSRCIACRIDENGELTSLIKGDYDKVIKYLAE